MSQDKPSTVQNPLSRWPENRMTRRQMIQRLGALGLALPSLPAILEACGGEATPATTTLSKDLKGSITIWGWKASLDALKLVDADFTAAFPNVTFKYVERPPADTYRNIQLAIAAGSGAPDVSVIEDSHLPQYVHLGALADITDWVKPYVSKMVSYKWTWTKKSNRYYAMPWDPGPVAVFYRRDVFQKAGVDPASIQTWDDFYQAAKTIKQKTGAFMWQQAKARNDGRLFETLLWQQGTGYIDSSGKVILDKDAKIQQTLEYIGRFWTDGLAADQEPWTDPWYKGQSSGTSATVIDAVWMGTFFKSFIAPKAAGSWGVFMLPVWQSGGSRASNDGGSVLAIFDQSSQKDAARAYVEFHLGQSGSQLKIYEKTDIFPSLKSAFEDPFFQEADPYFGDQKVRTMFAEIAAKIPDAGIYSTDYQLMSSLATPEIQKFALGQQSAQQALANAAQLIRERTHRS
jgi:ABC-type glycerol-3-phosphate transport system substrate-binding protein